MASPIWTSCPGCPVVLVRMHCEVLSDAEIASSSGAAVQVNRSP
uniref:Uncharacterized protein n=1 Tax=Arundo donax TaxID=35708 RepID=A0A0A9BZZ4_ARUDO